MSLEKCPRCIGEHGLYCTLVEGKCSGCEQSWTDDKCPMCDGELAKSHWSNKTHYCRKCAKHLTLKPTILQPQENGTIPCPESAMKKLITPAVLTAIGFAFFNEHVREVFMNQPQWLVIVEASIAYIVIGFLNGVEIAARGKIKGWYSVDVNMLGVLSGIFWPAYWTVGVPVFHAGKGIVKLCGGHMSRRMEKLRKVA